MKTYPQLKWKPQNHSFQLNQLMKLHNHQLSNPHFKSTICKQTAAWKSEDISFTTYILDSQPLDEMTSKEEMS